MRLSLLIPAALLGLFPLACSSEPPANDPYAAQGQYPPGGGAYPPNQGGYGQQPQGQYPPQGGYQNPQPAPAPAPAPGPAPAAGGATGAAQPIAAGMATPVLTALAASEIQGMQPEGGTFAGQFQEGQTLEQPLNIQAGKCYAVVGVGLPPIQELDIQIVVQPAPMIPATVLAQDNAQGANATVGGKGNCFRNPLPLGGPGKVIVRAVRGSGIAAAQIYVK